MRLGFFLAMFALLNIIVPVSAYASEEMHAGDVLEEDSLVFSMDEAQDLKVRIEDLEGKETLLWEYISLTDVQGKQIDSLEEIIESKDVLIAKHQEIHELDDMAIKRLDKQVKRRKLENVGSFIGGVLVAIALVLVADKVDDQMENDNLFPGIE